MSRAIYIKDLSIMSATGDPVLRDVNADIHVGEVALVSGSCGSGKTLLLKAIAGLVQSIYTGLRVSGYIEVYGYSPLDALKKGLVAYIPQDIALAGFTQSLREMLSTYRVNPDIEILRVLGVEDKASKPLNKLSAGERYRALVALVLHLGKKVVLIDEPSGYIDAESLQRLLEYLRRVSMNHEVVFVIADHRVAMYSGYVDTVVYIEGSTQCSPVSPARRESTRECVLRASDLSLRHDGRVIVENLSIEVHRGDVVAIVGPNGAGKTILVKTLLGLAKPYRGSVWRGYKSVMYIPQLASYWFREDTVAATVRFFGLNEDILDKAGLVEKAERIPHTLSLGEVRRLGLYLGLQSSKDLVVIDEISLGFDEETLYCVKDSLERVRESGSSAVVFTTHDYSLARWFNPDITVELMPRG